MAKVIEYDVTGVEESAGGTGVKVKPGVRIAKITQCFQREEKSDGTPANDIKVALNFGDEFDWGFTYIGLGEASDWKLAEFVRAVGLKDKGKLIPEKMVDKFVRVRVTSGTYEGEYSPQMGRLMKALPGDDKLWAEGNSGVSEISSSAAAASDEPEPDDTPDAEPEPDGHWREGLPSPDDPSEVVSSYDDWSDEDLTAEVEERGLTLPAGRTAKKTKMITALRADDEEQTAEPAGSDEPEDDGEGATSDDYDDWDLDQLKAEWTDRELGDHPSVRGSNAEGRIKAKIIEALRKDDANNPFEA